MNNVWSKFGSSYTLTEVSDQKPQLPVGIYKLEYDELRQRFYLDYSDDRYKFPYKVYGVEKEFIKRVCKTWDHSTGNMGILLNGVKGTGKTITAQLICNEMKLPVILVQKAHVSLLSFLHSLNEDVIVFIDEYEKIFDRYSNTLLSIMDGAFKSTYRKMFLLTTNELTIEKNMLQRPSRIRYVKTYSDLTLDVIMEVVDDLLIYPEHRENSIKVISELPIITMDLVKSIIEEVNIHNEPPSKFIDFFNVKTDEVSLYNVFKIDDAGYREKLYEKATVHPSLISTYNEGDVLYINNHGVGTIEKCINKNQIIVKLYNEPDELGEIQTTQNNELTTIILEPALKLHQSFAAYAF